MFFKRAIIILLPLAMLLIMLPADEVLQARGPMLVDRNSQAYVWSKFPIVLQADSGVLGNLSNEEARAIIFEVADEWASVPTAQLSFAEGTPLLEDITGSNILNFLDNLPDGSNPVIFDSDGSALDTLLGEGASKRFRGLAVTLKVDRKRAERLHGTFIVSGLVTRSQLSAELKRKRLRTLSLLEIGHFLGLDHSQPLLIPVMYPSSFQPTSLQFDDRTAISSLYPRSDFFSKTGTIRGRIFFPDGQTQFQGANVLAINTDDPLVNTAVVSGFQFIGTRRNVVFGSLDEKNIGFYEITGLPPGRYIVRVESIGFDFRGISGVGPLSPPVSLPGPAEFWNVEESNFDPPQQATAINIAAGEIREQINIILNSDKTTLPDFNIRFTPATVNVKRGQRLQMAIDISRESSFQGNVKITGAVDGLSNIVVKPAMLATQSTTSNFAIKIGKKAPLGTQQLTFIGRDAAGRVRLCQLILIIEK